MIRACLFGSLRCARRFGLRWVASVCVLTCLALSAQVDTAWRRPSSTPIRSRTGQFLVLGDTDLADPGAPPAIRVPVGPQRTLTLNPLRPLDPLSPAALSPSVLSVSCERVKAGVLRILRMEDRYRGSMVVRIIKTRARIAPASIVATQYADGWRYTLEIQERIPSTLLVRTMVEAVLLEIANRANGGPLNPIPLWLSEGITTLVIGESGQELVPQLNREFKDPRRSMDPMVAIAARLSGRPPMDFGELASPAEALPSDTERFPWFQGSSALLVHQLRSMGGAPGSLGRLIWAFNQTLNWQTAFLRTYSGDFHTLLEVEKWWGVMAMAFQVQDSAQRTTPDALAAQVRSVLLETAETAASTNGVPDRRTLRISEIIKGWPHSAHGPVLDRKLVQLRFMSRLGVALIRRDGIDPASRAAIERTVELTDQLLQVLFRYQEARSGGATGGGRRGDLDPRTRLLVSTTASRIGAIEEALLDTAPAPSASSAP